MIERGKVIKVSEDKKTATVRFERKSTCDKCGMCSFGPKETFIDLELENKLNAKPDDEAEVDITNGLVLKMSLIVYAIPLVISCVGLLIGVLMKLEEWLTFVLFIGFLGIGFLVLHFIDKKYAKNLKARPVMIKIIEEKNAAEENLHSDLSAGKERERND